MTDPKDGKDLWVVPTNGIRRDGQMAETRTEIEPRVAAQRAALFSHSEEAHSSLPIVSPTDCVTERMISIKTFLAVIATID